MASADQARGWKSREGVARQRLVIGGRTLVMSVSGPRVLEVLGPLSKTTYCSEESEAARQREPVKAATELSLLSLWSESKKYHIHLAQVIE